MAQNQNLQTFFRANKHAKNMLFIFFSNNSNFEIRLVASRMFILHQSAIHWIQWSFSDSFIDSVDKILLLFFAMVLHSLTNWFLVAWEWLFSSEIKLHSNEATNQPSPFELICDELTNHPLRCFIDRDYLLRREKTRLEKQSKMIDINPKIFVGNVNSVHEKLWTRFEDFQLTLCGR